MNIEPKVKSKKLYSLLKHSKQDSTGNAPLKKDGQTLVTETGKQTLKMTSFSQCLTPKNPISLKSLAKKSLQDLHDSGVNLVFKPSIQAKSPPKKSLT